MEIEILKAVTEIKIGDETVQVRELSWPQALEFLQKLSKSAGQLVDSGGKLLISPEKLSELVTSAKELSESLVLSATGRDSEWLAERSFGEMLDLIDAAVSQNVRPDFFAKIKRIGTRLGQAQAGSLPLSTSLSGRATPAAT